MTQDMDMSTKIPLARPEIDQEPTDMEGIGVVERPLGFADRLMAMTPFVARFS